MPTPSEQRSFHHRHAAILSIGDELTRGQTLDTNSRWLSQRLMDLGIEPIRHVTIPDSREATAQTIQSLARDADLVISTGGLGPTVDDLTRDGLADALDEGLVEDADALAALAMRLTARGRPMTDPQRTQSLRPRSAHCLLNANGTAPGLHAVVRGPATDEAAPLADVFALPGPPSELHPMFESQVVPLLRPEPGVLVRVRYLGVTGLGESEAASRVGEIMSRGRNPLVGITASGGILTWRICFRGRDSIEVADRAIADTAGLIRAAMPEHVFADSGEGLGAANAAGALLPEGGTAALAATVLAQLTVRGRTLAVAESCTGGLLGETITAIPGASSAFIGGFITYSNGLKWRVAGVRADTLAFHGAVSEGTAAELAVGALKAAAAHEALSITGIAGPYGGTPDKPVGTVFVACASRPAPGVHPASPAVVIRKLLIPGSRSDIRNRAAAAALSLLYFRLNSPSGGDGNLPRLLWEVHQPRSER